ncbi:MAG: hypothetical protein JXD23_04295 [Spirochaetales bacterium]|nr:hypothetical protein [Spirochaetales bacterium]
MKRFIFPACPALFFALLLCGCDLFSGTAAWTAVLPGLPAHWRDAFPNMRADLFVAAADGGTSVAEVSLEDGAWPVLVPKTCNTLVLLYPKAGADVLRPYGAVFPARADEETRTLALTAAGGFVAERLARLAQRGFHVGAFNSPRLLDLVEERGGDPWDLDPLLLETRLAEDNFSVYAVRKLDTRPVSLIPPPGQWFSESPAAPLWETDAGGLLVIPEMAYGTHTLFHRGGDERVYVQVSERDVIVFGP